MTYTHPSIYFIFYFFERQREEGRAGARKAGKEIKATTESELLSTGSQYRCP